MYYKSAKYKATTRRYERAHRTQRRAKQHRYYQKLKQDIFDHYGRKCAHCPIDDLRVLTIDHINGGGTKHRKTFKSPATFYTWLRRNNFPKGYQILCMNCQWLKRLTNNEIPKL